MYACQVYKVHFEKKYLNALIIILRHSQHARDNMEEDSFRKLGTAFTVSCHFLC